MQPPSQEISTCAHCGALLEEAPGGGLGCISCLLRAGIDSEEEVAQDSTPDAFEGDAHFGVYEIDRHEDGNLYELGRGAMGVTYRATDTTLQRKVALKIIKIDIAERSADARERFMREARAAAALRHENIAVIHQFGMRLETGQYFYAMELIEGETLEERVRRTGPIDVRTAIDVAQQVAAALAAAEKRGLIHRDLKPANLMLADADEAQAIRTVQRAVPTVKIIDFGLAKALNAQADPMSLTRDQFVGTPEFASPEQFDNAALDVRSDIYSLGVTLWFALTGKTPFAGGEMDEVHRAKLSNKLPVEQLKGVRVPPRLRSLLASMLAPEPAARPAVQDLAAQLRRCAASTSGSRRARGTLARAHTTAREEEELHLEIAHVLFIDVVGYSKLLVGEQREVVEELNQIVRKTPQFRKSESEGKLIRLPSGDGMALVFFQTLEEPIHCALEVARALKNHARICVRMGVHSGPVDQVKDVNDRIIVAGAGINMAERVMGCGDAGHILLSKRVADDLSQERHWHPLLHDLGEMEVKHGVRLGIVNLYTEELGNPEVPQKLKSSSGPGLMSATATTRTKPPWTLIGAAVLILVAIIFGSFLFWQQQKIKTAAATSGAPEKSIAVLPFENLSEEKQNEYFADGVQDEILNNLAKIADLKVISRTSVMQYKSGVARNLREIGEQLGVAHLLEGSVQRAANKVRVNAQLIDARTDAHLWGQIYDRDLADVFAIQSEIAKAIAEQLQAKLSPNEKKAIEQPPTTDLAAFDLYSRAKSLLVMRFYTATNVRKAIEFLDEAVKRDPSFFDAYCQLAWAHEALYATFGTDHTSARLALADAAVQAATRLRPDAGEALLARANYLYYGRRDYAGALAELEIARRALPNDPRLFELSGYILRRRGQQEEGLRNLQRAVELDPRNFFTLQQISLSYAYLGRYAEAIAALDRALSIVPDNVETKGTRDLYYFCWKGDTRPLHQTIDAILAQGPSAIARIADNWFTCALVERDTAAAERALVAVGDNPYWGDGAINLSHSFGEGLLARMTKDEARTHAAFEAARAQQEKIVQTQPDYGPTLCELAMIDAGLGRKELALEEGRRAIAVTPMEKDVINGSSVLQYFAITAAWAGDKELALQQLETGLRAPVASQLLSYGALKLLPFWDPLRGDPRFEKIVASLAPKGK